MEEQCDYRCHGYNGLVKGISGGSVSVTATGPLETLDGRFCQLYSPPACQQFNPQGTGSGTVLNVGAFGKDYIIVGSDPSILNSNHFQVANSAGNAGPQPPGGTCCAASSDVSDTATPVSGANPPEFVFQTLDQSATTGDRTLTFEYELSDGEGTSVQLSVTAREFAYATNSNPGNVCGLGYGTDRTYVYTMFTHPDHAAVGGGDAQGAAVTETFTPQLTCATITGNGSLNSNSQVSDHVTSACSNAPLTCTQTSTQTISVAGYVVRRNTLQWTGTGVNYTNNGPTQ